MNAGNPRWQQAAIDRPLPQEIATPVSFGNQCQARGGQRDNGQAGHDHAAAVEEVGHVPPPSERRRLSESPGPTRCRRVPMPNVSARRLATTTATAHLQPEHRGPGACQKEAIVSRARTAYGVVRVGICVASAARRQDIAGWRLNGIALAFVLIQNPRRSRSGFMQPLAPSTGCGCLLTRSAVSGSP